MASRYLSGNIYEKIDAAIAHDLPKNAAALETVLPPLVLPAGMVPSAQMALVEHLQIDLDSLSPDDKKRMLDDGFDFQMNSPWMPRNILNGFLSEIFMQKVQAVKLPAPALGWVLEDTSGSDRSLRFNDSARWGTREVSALEVALSALNFKKIKVREDGDLDLEASAVAEARREEMQEAFRDYVLADIERASAATKAYNRICNCYAPEKFDGSHLLLPSADQEVLKERPNRPHQNNAIWRIIQDRVTLIPHKVGSGKTRIMVAAAMECRRRGLAKKPLFVALKSTIGQIEASFRELYPSAKLLVADEKNFSAKNRGKFLAAWAGNDWDCVIISNSNWSKLS
ncbi:MAG TPA: DEAD/DEAH box helicase family protein, partial [Allocoleopsis sp.]